MHARNLGDILVIARAIFQAYLSEMICQVAPSLAKPPQNHNLRLEIRERWLLEEARITVSAILWRN